MMEPWLLVERAMLWFVVPQLFVKLSVPRPSPPIEYAPPVNWRMGTPVQMLTSSRPPVIFPRPSAKKVPTRAKKLPCPRQSSVPLIEKAYCPDKLALENFALGSG